MKTNLFLLISASLFFGACNNHPGSTEASNNGDTSSSMTTKTDVTQTTTPDTAKVSTAGIPDSSFLAKAYNIGTFEIKIAKLADKKSQNAKVKDFANMMIKDHTEMGKDVAALIQKKNYNKPTELPEELISKWEDMNKLSGKDFDK